MGWGHSGGGITEEALALHTVPSHSVLSTEACQRIPLNPQMLAKGRMLFTEQSASPNLTLVNKMGWL